MDSQLWTRVDDRFEHSWKLRQTWKSLINAPTTELGTQSWIRNVMACWNEACKIQAPFVNPSSPIREFKESVGRMLDVYSTHTGGTSRLKELGEPTLEVIETCFQHSLRAEYKQACLELEVRKDNARCAHVKNSTSNTAIPFNGPEPEGDHSHACICGVSHAGGIPGCFYLVPELRPPTFIVREKVEQRIERVLAGDRRLNFYVDKARAKARNGNVTPLQTSFSAETSEVDLSPPHVEVVAGWTHGHYDNSTTIGSETSTQTDIVPSSTFTPVPARTYPAKPPAQLHPLHKSWVISASSTICVCNDISRLTNFEPAEPDEKIFAHGQEVGVLGVGKAELRIESYEDGYQYVTFPEVWLVPEYYTNVIALNALEGFDITWVHRDDVLVMKNEPWCKVKRINGMHVLDYTPLQKEIM
ncbi:hypothetical protein Cpir12675_002178 [Ceratocystis pirilliformis]|uniref:Uncharacterized protein n=1 Tax=Ceratocystis pirilliformis TaxID=259994 RepID=A0ABR3ZAX6_9PEZI